DYTVLYNWFLYKWGLAPGTTTNMLNVCNQLEFFNGCMASDRGCFAVQNLIGGTDLNNVCCNLIIGLVQLTEIQGVNKVSPKSCTFAQKVARSPLVKPGNNVMYYRIQYII
ncbi:hypothetical protein ANCDUO_21873, partial [Ancylostoma duodenale]